MNMRRSEVEIALEEADDQVQQILMELFSAIKSGKSGMAGRFFVIGRSEIAVRAPPAPSDERRLQTPAIVPIG
jgi:hypothetical protein